MATRKTATKADDPFADDTENETAEQGTITENGPSYVRATLKGGGGYDAPWLVLTEPDLESMNAKVNDPDLLKEILSGLWKATDYFASQAPEGSASSGAPRGKGGGGVPPRQAPPADVKPEFCDHGKMVYKTGTSAKGPWRAWMCPTEKDDPTKCKPKFL